MTRDSRPTRFAGAAGFGLLMMAIASASCWMQADEVDGKTLAVSLDAGGFADAPWACYPFANYCDCTSRYPDWFGRPDPQEAIEYCTALCGYTDNLYQMGSACEYEWAGAGTSWGFAPGGWDDGIRIDPRPCIDGSPFTVGCQFECNCFPAHGEPEHWATCGSQGGSTVGNPYAACPAPPEGGFNVGHTIFPNLQFCSEDPEPARGDYLAACDEQVHEACGRYCNGNYDPPADHVPIRITCCGRQRDPVP